MGTADFITDQIHRDVEVALSEIDPKRRWFNKVVSINLFGKTAISD